jgi:hypothetical protein
MRTEMYRPSVPATAVTVSGSWRYARSPALQDDIRTAVRDRELRGGRRAAISGQGIVELILVAVLIVVAVIVVVVVVQHPATNTTNSNITNGLGGPSSSP